MLLFFFEIEQLDSILLFSFKVLLVLRFLDISVYNDIVKKLTQSLWIASSNCLEDTYVYDPAFQDCIMIYDVPFCVEDEKYDNCTNDFLFFICLTISVS